MGRKNIKKELVFKPSIEYLKETMDMPAKAKLEWLEEINNFTNKTLPKRKLKIQEKFGKGDI